MLANSSGGFEKEVYAKATLDAKEGWMNKLEWTEYVPIEIPGSRRKGFHLKEWETRFGNCQDVEKCMWVPMYTKRGFHDRGEFVKKKQVKV
mmetsp:Transcript_23195/g.39649  ORF Transcript_23195/g.39649 Transcript_23195/m.39649 type:complete len:91 (-) Transcript_23195:282-554(-)